MLSERIGRVRTGWLNVIASHNEMQALSSRELLDRFKMEKVFWRQFEIAQARVPTALFKVSLLESPDRQYDVSPDGTRILVNRVSRGTEATHMTVVLDWAAGLEGQ